MNLIQLRNSLKNNWWKWAKKLIGNKGLCDILWPPRIQSLRCFLESHFKLLTICLLCKGQLQSVKATGKDCIDFLTKAWKTTIVKLSSLQNYYAFRIVLWCIWQVAFLALRIDMSIHLMVNNWPVNGHTLGSLTHSLCTNTPLGYLANWQSWKFFLQTTQ